jgi:2,4-dienoyl-CoA reductase-like NADH-dependent reductase (Old Yellow Enzyme family)
MVTYAQNKLFTPVQIGPIKLKHRIVMPPMSRLRAQWPSGVPSDLMLKYYCQRASDGGLMFIEATATAATRRSDRSVDLGLEREPRGGAYRAERNVQRYGGQRSASALPLSCRAAQRLRTGLSARHRTPDKRCGLIAEEQGPVAAQELSKIFRGPIIAAGGFEPDTAEATVANGDADLIAFGRHFISNPDLPRRIELSLPLNPYDRSTFYAFDGHGYIDYPAYDPRELDEACVVEKVVLGMAPSQAGPTPGKRPCRSTYA